MYTSVCTDNSKASVIVMSYVESDEIGIVYVAIWPDLWHDHVIT